MSRFFLVEGLPFRTLSNLYQKELLFSYDKAVLRSDITILLDSVLPCWKDCRTFHSIISISVGSVSGCGCTKKGFAIISLWVLHDPNLLTF